MIIHVVLSHDWWVWMEVRQGVGRANHNDDMISQNKTLHKQTNKQTRKNKMNYIFIVHVS